jgi:hypothetical protein
VKPYLKANKNDFNDTQASLCGTFAPRGASNFAKANRDKQEALEKNWQERDRAIKERDEETRTTN